MSQYDAKFDLKIMYVIVIYIPGSSNFAVYFEEYLMYKHHI